MKVQGSQLLDDNGKTVILRGAMIESGFAYINTWKKNGAKSVTNVLNPTVFQAMVSWGMNVIRINASCWFYKDDGYMPLLEQVVSQANDAGLYVVLDLHDDGQSGSPYTGGDFPKQENIPFWQDIASTFGKNSKVIFDLYNEPHAGSNWKQWYNGGQHAAGLTGVGFKPLIDAVRASSQNPIVLEPGNGTWADFDPSIVSDTNVIYSKHIYESIIDPPDVQTKVWGQLLDKVPLYYGEWAFLCNAYQTAHCEKLPTDPTQAEKVVNDFLSFMEQHQINWTAWAFTPGHLVVDMASLQPTTLQTAWKCGDNNPQAGMGEVVQKYLQPPPPPPAPTVTIAQVIADVQHVVQELETLEPAGGGEPPAHWSSDLERGE